MMRFKENPEPQPGMCGPGFDEKIMHANLRIGETQVMASDGMAFGGKPEFKGFSPSITSASGRRARCAAG